MNSVSQKYHNFKTQSIYCRNLIFQFNKKRGEFRKYLEGAGAINNLTQALTKLYEQENKPTDAVKFIRSNLCESCPDEEKYELLVADLQKSKQKLFDLEKEILCMKGSIKRTLSEIDFALTKGFEDLAAATDSSSLLKQMLTKDILNQLKEKRTKFKGTILDCIKSGLENTDSPIGVYACDAEAYTIFEPLFNPVIKHLHGFNKEDKQPAVNFGVACKLPELDFGGSFVKSIRISCSRAINGYPFAAIMSMKQYEEIMERVQNAVSCMSGDLKGKFHPLDIMDQDLRKILIDQELLFSEPDENLKIASATRFWPIGRGIFINDAKNFAIWCNEEDHLRFISMENSGNISKFLISL